MTPPSHFLAPLLEADGRRRLYVEGSSEPLATQVESAFDSASRKRGLLGRETMGNDEALVIAPCNGVHTFRMRFPIDVIYVARDGRIVKLHESMAPGRLKLLTSRICDNRNGGRNRRPRALGLRLGDRLVVR